MMKNSLTRTASSCFVTRDRQSARPQAVVLVPQLLSSRRPPPRCFGGAWGRGGPATRAPRRLLGVHGGGRRGRAHHGAGEVERPAGHEPGEVGGELAVV